MFPLRPEGVPEVAMGLREAGSQADDLAQLGDRLVRLPQAQEDIGDVVAEIDGVGFEPDRLAVLRDRLGHFPLVLGRELPELIVGRGQDWG